MWRGTAVLLLLTECTSVRVVDDDDDSGGSSAVTTPTTSSGGSLPSGGESSNGGAAQNGGASPSGGASPNGGAAPTPCAPGETQSCYEGAPETSGVGSCAAGTRECLADGADFGPCLGQVLPEADDDCQTPEDEDCDGFAIASCEGFFPLPPTSSDFGWQTLQEHFVKDGVPCHAEVTVAVGDNASCYAGADDQLYCAGYVFGGEAASPYVDMGLEGPLQILFGPSIVSPVDYGNSMCALLRDGTMMCRGLNGQGQFGLGHDQPVDTFTPWAGRADIARVATNTFDTICALTISGEVLCAGAGFGNTPVAVGNGSKVWVDLDGGVHLDESPIRRVSPGFSWCTIDGAGVFDCPLFTVPLLVDGIVDGGFNGGMSGTEACYLDVDGDSTVSCTHLVLLSKETIQHFDVGSVLALATSPGDAPLCAVYTDGSLWCVGKNYSGQLGFESPYTLQVDTQILPPGTVRTACE